MKDPRIDQLAKGLVQYSLKVQKGENVLIEIYGSHDEMVTALIREVYRAGGHPQVRLRSGAVNRALLMEADEETIRFWRDDDAQLMKTCQCYIGIRGDVNSAAGADVPSEKLRMYNAIYYPDVHHVRISKTRWVVLRYPTPSMAQQASMSTEAFEDFYFDVCCLDYAKMAAAMQPLIRLLEKTDRVRLTAKGTDISFSIKGLPAIPCAGELNIPDGEVFTAPVKDTVNGTITFNTPSMYNGRKFENISLTFENGRIVKFSGSDPEAMESIFNTDEGARYVGEFAIGVNPYVKNPMLDTLFDEKISGSIHFTPGNAYDECFNGNRSSIHWDLVLIQTPEYGGGDIYFDDRLIRHDGRFVIDELACLNPENLK